jgi:hypothetical protein
MAQGAWGKGKKPPAEYENIDPRHLPARGIKKAFVAF